MRFLILVILLLNSSFIFANNVESKVEKLLMSYLQAIKSKNKNELKKTVSDKYFKELEKDKGLESLFSMQSNDKKPIIVDIKVVKQKLGLRCNIKNKTDKEYDDYWYQIIKVGSNYKIDGTFHLEEHHKK